MGDVADLLATLGTGTYTVTREAAGAYGAGTGIWVPGTTSMITVRGSLQPASGRDARHLPEGVVTSDARVLYTEEALQVTEDGSLIRADLVDVGGEVFEVLHTEPWGGNLLPHYRSLLTRRGRGE